MVESGVYQGGGEMTLCCLGGESVINGRVNIDLRVLIGSTSSVNL